MKSDMHGWIVFMVAGIPAIFLAFAFIIFVVFQKWPLKLFFRALVGWPIVLIGLGFVFLGSILANAGAYLLGDGHAATLRNMDPLGLGDSVLVVSRERSASNQKAGKHIIITDKNISAAGCPAVSAYAP